MLEKTPLGNEIDVDMPLSSQYILSDLCVTNTGFVNYPEPNSPELKNLAWLAQTLEYLEADFGPFRVASAFRTKQVQDAIGTKPSNLKSFHEAGMAADLTPLDQSSDDFFAKILASNWLSKLGEIEYKPELNNVHISLPTRDVVAKVTILDQAGTLIRQTADDISQWAQRFSGQMSDYGAEVVAQVSDVLGLSSEDDSGEFAYQSEIPWKLILISSLLAGGAIIYAKRRKNR